VTSETLLNGAQVHLGNVFDGDDVDLDEWILNYDREGEFRSPLNDSPGIDSPLALLNKRGGS